MPKNRVTAKPFTGPDPMMNRIDAVMTVVILASMIGD